MANLAVIGAGGFEAPRRLKAIPDWAIPHLAVGLISACL